MLFFQSKTGCGTSPGSRSFALSRVSDENKKYHDIFLRFETFLSQTFWRQEIIEEGDFKRTSDTPQTCLRKLKSEERKVAAGQCFI